MTSVGDSGAYSEDDDQILSKGDTQGYEDDTIDDEDDDDANMNAILAAKGRPAPAVTTPAPSAPAAVPHTVAATPDSSRPAPAAKQPAVTPTSRPKQQPQQPRSSGSVGAARSVAQSDEGGGYSEDELEEDDDDAAHAGTLVGGGGGGGGGGGYGGGRGGGGTPGGSAGGRYDDDEFETRTHGGETHTTGGAYDDAMSSATGGGGGGFGGGGGPDDRGGPVLRDDREHRISVGQYTLNGTQARLLGVQNRAELEAAVRARLERRRAAAPRIQARTRLLSFGRSVFLSFAPAAQCVLPRHAPTAGLRSSSRRDRNCRRVLCCARASPRGGRSFHLSAGYRSAGSSTSSRGPSTRATRPARAAAAGRTARG